MLITNYLQFNKNKIRNQNIILFWAELIAQLIFFVVNLIHKPIIAAKIILSLLTDYFCIFAAEAGIWACHSEWHILSAS